MNDELKTYLEKHFTEINARFETMATKADLARTASKEDLKLMATKEDLKPLATKADLVVIRDQVAANSEVITQVKQQIRHLDAKIDQRFDGVMSTLDAHVDKNAREHVDHENRISDLESIQGITPPPTIPA